MNKGIKKTQNTQKTKSEMSDINIKPTISMTLSVTGLNNSIKRQIFSSWILKKRI